MVQCLVSIAIIVPGWNNPDWINRQSDAALSIFGYNGYAGFVSAITVGYFVWDLAVCLLHFDLFGFGFLLHAFAAFVVFTCTLRPYCLPWVPAFLLFEASTPFVNINWFASRLPAGTVSDKVVAINGLLLLVVFFVVRILWGFYAVSLVSMDMWATLDQASLFFPAVILGLNMSLNVLNTYWFYKMVMIAKKKFLASKVKTPKLE